MHNCPFCQALEQCVQRETSDIRYPKERIRAMATFCIRRLINGVNMGSKPAGKSFELNYCPTCGKSLHNKLWTTPDGATQL